MANNLIKDALGSGLDLIWIVDAQAQFRRSRAWLDKQMYTGKVRSIPQPGSSKVYLVYEDLVKVAESNARAS